MKIVLLAVGKLKNVALREICADYLARLQRYGGAEVVEVKAADLPTAEKSVEQESERLLAELEPSDQVCVLDERGAQVSSVELSSLIQNHEVRSTRKLVFVLGGAYGLSPEVRARGKLVSLSKLTLPHELCRALALEQLYRARAIQHKHPYHHA